MDHVPDVSLETGLNGRVEESEPTVKRDTPSRPKRRGRHSNAGNRGKPPRGAPKGPDRKVGVPAADKYDPLSELRLSKEATPTQDQDPAWMTELNVSDVCFLAAKNIRRALSVSAYGLSDVLNSEYDALANRREFKRHISRSMFTWYGNVLYWLRLCLVKRYERVLPEDLDVALECVNADVQIPGLLFCYLSGLGTCETSDGRKFHPSVDVFPELKLSSDTSGFFGIIDSTSIWKYRDFISPGLLVRRMLADLEYTLNIAPSIWKPPVDMCPPDDPDLDGLVMTDLLGYRDAEQIGLESQKVLLSSMFRREPTDTDSRPGFKVKPNVHSDAFCYNRTLFNFINGHLRLCTGKHVMHSGLPTSVVGSTSQLLYLDQERFGVPRYSVHSSSPVEIKTLSLALLFAYRFKRKEKDRGASSSSTTAKWSSDLNHVFMRNRGLNVPRFSTAAEDRQTALSLVAERFITDVKLVGRD